MRIRRGSAVQLAFVGIPDEDSYFRQSYIPTGRATGWRRVVFFGVLGLLAFGLLVYVVMLVTGIL